MSNNAGSLTFEFDLNLQNELNNLKNELNNLKTTHDSEIADLHQQIESLKYISDQNKEEITIIKQRNTNQQTQIDKNAQDIIKLQN